MPKSYLSGVNKLQIRARNFVKGAYTDEERINTELAEIKEATDDLKNLIFLLSNLIDLDLLVVTESTIENHYNLFVNGKRWRLLNEDEKDIIEGLKSGKLIFF